MKQARHPGPPELVDVSRDKLDDYRRAQHRLMGAGGSGKHDDEDGRRVTIRLGPWKGIVIHGNPWISQQRRYADQALYRLSAAMRIGGV